MSDKLSGDEVSSRVLAILQSSDFTKTLESFSGEKLNPTMNIMAKKINKAKKKLKKLQKRQRKQDKQGVVSFDAYFAESNELIKKLGDVLAAGIKDIYGKEYRVSADQWNEEQRSKAKESNAKLYEINKINPTINTTPKIIAEMTMEQWYEWRKKQPISDGDRVEVKLGGCDEWFKGTVIRARKQEVELDPHEYTYPKIADETNTIDIRII